MRYYAPEVSIPLEFMTRYFSLAETAIKLVGEKYRFAYAGDKFVIAKVGEDFYCGKDTSVPVNTVTEIVPIPPQVMEEKYDAK